MTVSDENGNTSTCTATVSVEDNTPPSILCSNPTIEFNGEANITVNITQLYNLALSSDNCGTVNILSPSNDLIIDCDAVGTTITETIEAGDGNGNMQTCQATITVEGLPCGWANDGGIGCNSLLNEATYDANLDQYELTANSCTANFPYVSDNVAFVYTELCGNGQITARVMDVAGDGIAGVMIRNSLDPGSPMAAIGTNHVNRIERQSRVLQNYPAYPQEVLSYDKYWVRIIRTGNFVQGFASEDGITWVPYINQQISLSNNCILVGLYTYNKEALSSVTSTFDNVSVTNQNSTLASLPNDVILGEKMEAPLDINVFPNPVNQELTIDLSNFIGQQLSLKVLNNIGQNIMDSQIEEIEVDSKVLDMSEMKSGIYYLVVNINDTQFIKRVVVATR